MSCGQNPPPTAFRWTYAKKWIRAFTWTYAKNSSELLREPMQKLGTTSEKDPWLVTAIRTWLVSSWGMTWHEGMSVVWRPTKIMHSSWLGTDRQTQSEQECKWQSEHKRIHWTTKGSNRKYVSLAFLKTIKCTCWHYTSKLVFYTCLQHCGVSRGSPQWPHSVLL